MAKLTLSNLANLNNQTSAVNTINANSDLIETAIENTLSRDGTTPNTMGAALDLNGNDILNVGNIVISGEILEGSSVSEYVEFLETTIPATPVANRLRLYARDEDGETRLFYTDSDGTELEVGRLQVDYTEFTETSTPSTPDANNLRLYAFDNGGTTTLVTIDSAGTILDLTHFTQAGTGATLRTQEAKLRETGVSVKDYGAVGDGSAADRTAFVNAYTQAVISDVPWVIPGGNYNLASNYIPAAANLKISMSPDVEFNGVGSLRFDSLIPYQIAPTFAREFIYGEYDSSFSAYFGIFQNASFAKANLATAAVVAQFGEAEAAVASSLAWGGNFVGVSSFSGGTALALEINPVVVAAGGIAYGVVIASAGTQPSTAAIQIQSNESASRFANGIIFNNTTHDATTGSLILGNVGGADRGIDLSLMEFATAEMLLPSFVVGPTPGSINSQIRVDGSASGLPELTAVGSATNITMILRAKGSGTIFSGDGFLSDDPLKGIGYAAGAGGTVTQITNRSTAVTLNKISGQITTHNASLAAETSASFTVNNSAVAATDTVVVSIAGGVNGGNTDVFVAAVQSGLFAIRVANNNAAGGTAETGAIVINYAVIKAVAS